MQKPFFWNIWKEREREVKQERMLEKFDYLLCLHFAKFFKKLKLEKLAFLV